MNFEKKSINNIIKKNYFFEVILKFLNIVISSIFSIIILSITVNKLQSEYFGYFTVFISFINLVNIITQFGIPNYSFKAFLSNSEKSVIFFSNAFYLSFIVSFFLILTIFFIYLIDIFTYDKNILLLIALYIVSNIFNISWYFNILRLQQLILFKNILLNISTLLFAIFLLEIDSIYIYFSSIYLLSFIIDFFLFLLIKPKFSPFSFKTFIEFIKNSFPFFLVSIFTLLFVNSDLFIITYYLSPLDISYYSFATKVYFLIKNFLSIIVTSSQPKISYYSNHDLNKFYSNSLNIILLLLTIFSAFIPFLIINNSTIIKFFGGSLFLNSIYSINIILYFSLFFSIITWAINYLIQINIGLEKHFLIASFYSGIINLVLNLIFIKDFGILFAAFTTLLSEFILFLFTFKSLKIFIKSYIKTNFFNIFKFLILILIILISSIILNLSLINFTSNLFHLSFLNLLIFSFVLILFDAFLKLDIIKKTITFLK